MLLNVCFELDFSTWELKELKNALFLEKPHISPRTPSWDAGKVLKLWSSTNILLTIADKFLQLKKSLILVALACGNSFGVISSNQKQLGTNEPIKGRLSSSSPWFFVQ